MGRPTTPKDEPQEKKARGRPKIYEVGTKSKTKDHEYIKMYYQNVIKNEREQQRIEPSPTLDALPETKLTSISKKI